MSSLPEYIVKLIDDIAKREQFSEYRIELLGDALKRGENFTGKLAFLQLSGTRSNDGQSTPSLMHLALKTVPSNRNRREVFQGITGFKCEVEMYTKVLPRLVAFQDEKHVNTEDQFLAFPKVYASVFDESNDRFAIVMEDLRIKNYRISSRLNNTTYEHARLVVTKLARFHAISFAMRDQNLNAFHEIVRNEKLSSQFMKDDLGYEIVNIFDRSIAALQSEKHKKLIEDLKTNYLEWVEKFSNEQFVGESGVLLHGDCGNKNVLFQYDDDVLCYLIYLKLSEFKSQFNFRRLYKVHQVLTHRLANESLWASNHRSILFYPINNGQIISRKTLRGFIQ